MTPAAKMTDAQLALLANRGESIEDTRDRIQCRDDAAESQELADVVAFHIAAEKLRDRLADLIATHEGECLCPLCICLQASGDLEHFNRAMDALLFNLDSTLAAVEGAIPLTPRAWRIRERAKQAAKQAARAAG